ncbi:MAG: hypothetical protein US75_C0038G0011 [Candidatus Woesebacteria bacterium GW2011_GWC1_38_13]|uniref:DUF1648 domain-containing protein n=2 Tax=Candidatus Woeseibacteriota TaxID=1752722 RepID=A0A0G0IJD4_9BACT|nr:MAG: hypothetical protein US67_C0068G0004 [Candidatus Woesebacteria bacterium GW2011_GWD1_38_10]KKQ54747.1 MAG: hypothetical protein US75_C0038G0011 [Candidatus Woesebacteria bacterium GW2011_GWC1_38_13]KKQ76108.1 MAG: hypothetical protein US97_C0021G0006 [Microgenomates group bacterium GW2011_GWF1_38_5]
MNIQDTFFTNFSKVPVNGKITYIFNPVPCQLGKMKKTAQKKITNIPKNPLSKLRKDIEKYKILYIHTSLIFLFINICLIISILVISNHIPPQVPLYYGLPRGESQLGSSLSLILPISLSSIFVAINSIISYFTVSSFLKKVLIIGSYFTVILSIITVIQIISLLIFF